MQRILKVFVTGAEQDQVAAKLPVIERYEAFVLVAASEEQARRLGGELPVQDITALYDIRLGETTITTAQPRMDARGKLVPHPAYKGAKKLSRGPHHYLVQFVGPIKDAWLAQVKRAGGQIRASHGDFACVVRADDQAIRNIARLPCARWIGHLPHRHRVAPSVYQHLSRKAGDRSAALPRTRVMPGVYAVEFFGADDLKAAVPAVRKQGFKLLGQDEKAAILVIQAREGASQRRKQIEALSGVHGVRAIRERVVPRPSNDVAALIMGTATSMASDGLGLSGRGEVVAVCDTGLDTGDPATIHRDFAHRIVWIKSYPITPDYSTQVLNPGGDDGPADLDSGHGTHVAGSVLGDGSLSVGLPGVQRPIQGLAHGAQLVFQAVEQEMKWKPKYDTPDAERFLLAGIPLDLRQLLRDAYKHGARIHSNSWSGGDPGAYDSQCEQLDRFVWEHQDFCVLVAAGNDGHDRDRDGKINPMSVTSPSSAKNCITVGACESRRVQFQHQLYGEVWGEDYPVAPYKNDPMADNPEQVAAFSSRGPTADGRVKPDVVAPGTFILSTRSTRIAPNNFAFGHFPPSKAYFYMVGTSMATPLTAGAVALIREYYRRKKKVKNPTAALLKATLIAGAIRLPGEKAILDNEQGFGRVNLDAVLAPPAPATTVFEEISPGVKTGASRSIALKVLSSQTRLRVVLAYTDYPGSALVNDLNLIVRAPDGKRFVGNQPEGAGMSLDTRNNVELVEVSEPVSGAWTIQVVGSNVPRGPQAFAVVAIGHLKS